MSQVSIPNILDMSKAGVHFGHQSNKWHPNMDQYIYTTKNTVHIIDLEKTQEKLKQSLDFVRELSKNGGVILFLGTKNIIKETTKKYAEKADMPYINARWIGGTLTNFTVIHRLIKKLREFEIKKEKGDFSKYTKKERHEFDTEIERLNKMIIGIKKIDKLPDLIFMLDTKDEKTAIQEAKKLKLPTMGIVDTNCNPENVNYPIPANDDAIKSVEMITDLIVQAIEEGKKEGGESKQIEEKKEEKKEVEEVKEVKEKKEEKEEKEEKKSK